MDGPATGLSHAPGEADDAHSYVDKLRVLELYSGIGGMHFACPPERTWVVAAVDVNTTANSVYAFNFPDTRLLQRNVLKESGYHVHRYLLSPTQFGIPNSRLRFYCLAKLHPAQFRDCCQKENGVCTGMCQEQPPPGSPESGPPQSLSAFLSLNSEQYLGDEASYLLPDKILSRFSLLLDIVQPASTNTCCFTKGYGHYVEGTGSVLLQVLS
ncbi:hypothetical protein HPB50_016053 [Hyalomma asiaticum]|uniref:Uncharacterized protein n=1 Tax=Hyalomma asiaticum TaxID=266040 RepID=A0ACB7RU80_HYAAI|nr:hypothetical protein HPB50_016053 [Hyalomma asiaticum]